MDSNRNLKHQEIITNYRLSINSNIKHNSVTGSSVPARDSTHEPRSRV